MSQPFSWDDFEYGETYLQASSEHGSDGEPYVPEPSQNDEMVRQFRRRQSRQERTSESPVRAPRPSASKSEDLTRSHFAAGGALDSQTTSQAYIAGLYLQAEPDINTQQEAAFHPTSSPEHTVKDEPVGSPLPEQPETRPSEMEQLQEEIRRINAARDAEQGRYFTLLEQANQERDRYRAEARKWEAHAERAVNLLRQARTNIEDVLGDFEGELGRVTPPIWGGIKFVPSHIKFVPRHPEKRDANTL
ncbi:hypothetical protein B0H14DRAFT_3693423 [Mycena olivaceomarginata]|nr:hypothetical protein B0H14DRAFT_3693423 [Mycena olivaceomarginata]